MKAKALRLPDNLLDAVKFAEKKEKLDEPTTIRKFLRLGAEKYVADSYARGEISLREAAKVLDITIREVLELFWDMGITGNLDAGDTLNAISFVQKKLSER
jgi:predicted HTH domain antitoxin